MTIYTIEVGYSTIKVLDGRVKKSRLKYTMPGIEIYVIGAVSVARRDKVNYHAFEIARAHHIKLSKIISHGWC